MKDAILKVILGITQSVEPPKEVVVVEHWYDYHEPFKILVDGQYFFWATSKELAEKIASQVRENRWPSEISLK